MIPFSETIRFIAVLTLLADSLILPASAQGTNTPGFREVFQYDLGEYWCENHLATADFDRDGWMDMVVMVTAVGSTNGPPWHHKSRAILLHNEGDGTFTDSIVADYPTNSNYGYFALAADLNRDGAPDLVLRESKGSHVLLNDGAGRGFREVSTFQPGYAGMASLDMNRDGFPDLVSGTQTGNGGRIELFRNDGTGTNFARTWQSRLYGSDLDNVQTVLIANLNGDDRPDIAAREIYSGLLVTLHGHTNGTSFVEQNALALGNRTFALAGGNVNGDSLTDLAVHVGWGQVRVFVTQTNGSLSPYWDSPDLGQPAFNLALADFDQDGFDDVFVGTYADGALRIYHNRPGVGFDLEWQGSLTNRGQTGTAADVNGDGYPDLIVGEKNHLRVWLNRNGIPKIKSLSMGQSLPMITWSASPGCRYQVQSKDQLDGIAWTDVGGDVIATNLMGTWMDAATGPARQRFYRVIELP